MPLLLIRDRGASPKLHKLRGLLTYVGRDAGCAVVLPNTAISRRHVKLSRKDGAWLLEDLDTPNGTLLNDQPVKSAALQHGDVIRIGRFKLEFVDELQLPEMERRKLDMLHHHGGAPVEETSATFVFEPGMREKMVAAERAKEGLVVFCPATQQRWRPEGRPLTFGPSGDVPSTQLFRSTPLAKLGWNGKSYTLARTGFWGRVQVNGRKVTGKVSLKVGDELRVGSGSYVLRDEPV
jgi:pSer/pThr/pTyr-binding forkhead associated (FHA) protein